MIIPKVWQYCHPQELATVRGEKGGLEGRKGEMWRISAPPSLSRPAREGREETGRKKIGKKKRKTNHSKSFFSFATDFSSSFLKTLLTNVYSRFKNVHLKDVAEVPARLNFPNSHFSFT